MIKMFGWEPNTNKKIDEKRQEELKWIKKRKVDFEDFTNAIVTEICIVVWIRPRYLAVSFYLRDNIFFTDLASNQLRDVDHHNARHLWNIYNDNEAGPER